MYNLAPKLLQTCNPAKNYLYREYYLPHRGNILPEWRKFVQALPEDNKRLPDGYLENLERSLNPNERERLLKGNWEIDTDASALIDYNKIIDILRVPSFEYEAVELPSMENPSEILGAILDYAASNGLLGGIGNMIGNVASGSGIFGSIAGVITGELGNVLGNVLGFPTTGVDSLVRIGFKSGHPYSSYPGILSPLAMTGGVVFPYRPTIDISRSVNYDAVTPIHSMQDFKSFRSNSSVALMVSGQLSLFTITLSKLIILLRTATLSLTLLGFS